MDPDPDPGGPKTCGFGSGSGSPTLILSYFPEMTGEKKRFHQYPHHCLVSNFALFTLLYFSSSYIDNKISPDFISQILASRTISGKLLI
jgi:hypothetical protein